MLKRVVHPGEILSDELTEFGITPTAFARQINVPPNRISQIIAGRRSVTGDTALRFGHWFGVDPQFWLNLQTQFDLAIADQRISRSLSNKRRWRGREGASHSLRASVTSSTASRSKVREPAGEALTPGRS